MELASASGSPVTVLTHHHADTGIGEPLAELGPPIIQARCPFAHGFRDLLAFGGGIVPQPLLFSVCFLVSRGNPRIECNRDWWGHCRRFLDKDGVGVSLGGVQIARLPPPVGRAITDTHLFGLLTYPHGAIIAQTS